MEWCFGQNWIRGKTRSSQRSGYKKHSGIVAYWRTSGTMSSKYRAVLKKVTEAPFQPSKRTRVLKDGTGGASFSEPHSWPVVPSSNRKNTGAILGADRTKNRKGSLPKGIAGTTKNQLEKLSFNRKWAQLSSSIRAQASSMLNDMVRGGSWVRRRITID
jgi:hypothetical protein